MKLNPDENIKQNKNYETDKALDISNQARELPVFMSDFLVQLRDSENITDLFKELKQKDNEFIEVNPVLHRYKNYTILEMNKAYGQDYKNNLKKISKLDLSIAPKLKAAIEKRNDMFIIVEYPKVSTADLMPYNQLKEVVEKNAKVKAYKDLIELTKNGLVNEKLLNNSSNFYVTSDRKNIIVPDWSFIRQTEKGEGRQILEHFHKTLFNS